MRQVDICLLLECRFLLHSSGKKRARERDRQSEQTQRTASRRGLDHKTSGVDACAAHCSPEQAGAETVKESQAWKVASLAEDLLSLLVSFFKRRPDVCSRCYKLLEEGFVFFYGLK